VKKSYICCILLFCLLAGSGFSAEPISKIRERIEKTGKLRYKSDPEVQYMQGDHFRQFIHRYFESAYPAEMAEKEARYLTLMGFLDPGVSLNGIRKRLVMNNAGGMYDEQTGKLMILNEYMHSDPVYRLILVHELRHALQDQHFNIAKLFGNLSDFDDRKIAVTAALEGDAMLLMTRYADKYTPFPVSPELSLSGYNSDALLTFSPVKFSHNLDNVPAAIKHHLSMPYIQGLKFTFSIFKKGKGKWGPVNRILKDPPVSSEQILHPEKYMKKELPADAAPSFVPAGYELYHSGTVGEFMLNILLMKKNRYMDTAAGWGGDTFRLYTKGDSYILIWKSVWDQDEFCSRFYTDFRNFTESRFGVSYRKGNVKGNPFIAGRNQGQYFFLRKFANKMFYFRTNNREEMNTFINGGHYD